MTQFIMRSYVIINIPLYVKITHFPGATELLQWCTCVSVFLNAFKTYLGGKKHKTGFISIKGGVVSVSIVPSKTGMAPMPVSDIKKHGFFS